MKYIFLFILAFSNYVLASDVIVSNKDHYITKDNLRGYIEFSIEFLSDFENNLDGKYPDKDYAMIYLDVNGNSLIDPELDRYYGAIDSKGICTGLLIEERVTRPCGSFNSKAKMFTYFMKSEYQPMPHPIIKYLIPVDELFSNSEYAYVVFQLRSKGIGFSAYPGDSLFKRFDATIRIKK